MRPEKAITWIMIACFTAWLLACTPVRPTILSTPVPTTAPRPTAIRSKAVSPQVLRRIDLSKDLFLRQIGDGAYVITTTFPWAANSLLVEMADGTLVIAGSPPTPEMAIQVMDWARKQFGQRKIVAINTGYHADNLGGNQAFLEAGIPVYGSDLTARLIRERNEQVRQDMLKSIGAADPATYEAQLKVKYPPPDHTFPIDAGLRLDFGSEQVRVYFPGPSQAPDKVVVYFPGRRLLFGSCMVIGFDQMGNTADADLKGWPDAVRKLAQFPADVIVPGHGDRLDPGLLQHTLDLLGRVCKPNNLPVIVTITGDFHGS